MQYRKKSIVMKIASLLKKNLTGVSSLWVKGEEIISILNNNIYSHTCQRPYFPDRKSTLNIGQPPNGSTSFVKKGEKITVSVHPSQSR